MNGLGYRVVKKAWQNVQPFWYNTSVWQTDGRTDGRTDRRQAYSYYVLQPVWLLVPVSLTSMTTSLRSFVMFSVCALMNTVQGSTNCFWLCPRLGSSVFQGRLHSSGRHLSPVKPPFGSTWRYGCVTDQNLIAGAFTFQHQSSGMPFLSLSQLNIHQSRTFKSWVKNQGWKRWFLRFWFLWFF